jgi:6-phosphogluconate dehydrogenase
MTATADFGLIGLAVMGENLALNLESRGYTVAVFNRTTAKVTEFVEGRAKGKNFVGAMSYKEFAESLKVPRKAIIMVRAGDAVDQTIHALLEGGFGPGDVIIDGGNSNYNDSNRRYVELNERGVHFVGAGVSGGEEGALLGPSIMPGGSREGWEICKDYLQAVCAKVDDGSPCCDYVGEAGSGHFVKMVHNGIEYGDMQLISEAYFLLKNALGLGNEEIADVFERWNVGDLDSYLIEITTEIFRKKDEQTGQHVVDIILDAAGQKGTGKWTVESGLNVGSPVTLIGEAVFARTLSSQKEERETASHVLTGPGLTTIPEEEKEEFIEAIRQATFGAKIISYAQGYVLLRDAAKEYGWTLNFGGIALMWRGGCIIRSTFLGKIKEAFDNNPSLNNLLLDDFFHHKIDEVQQGWRKVAAYAMINGVPIPAISSALCYYDGYRSARLPANLLQAQRDYFGAHTYERVDKPRGVWEHTNWTGRGGSTSSTSYNA